MTSERKVTIGLLTSDLRESLSLKQGYLSFAVLSFLVQVMDVCWVDIKGVLIMNRQEGVVPVGLSRAANESKKLSHLLEMKTAFQSGEI